MKQPIHLTDYAENATLLSQALFQGASLAELVQMASEMLGNPCYVTNDAFRVIAWYPKHPLGIPHWDRLIQDECYHYENVKHIMDGIDQFSEKTFETQTVHTIPPFGWFPDLPCSLIVSPIFLNEELGGMGGFQVISFQKPFSPSDEEFSLYIGQVLAACLLKQEASYISSKNFPFSLIQELLKETGSNLPLLQKQLSLLNLDGNDDTFSVSYIHLRTSQKTHAGYFASVLVDRFPFLWCCLYKGDLIAVIHNSDDHPNFLTEYTDFQSRHELSASISGSFHSLLSLRKNYSLARTSWYLASRQTKAFTLVEDKYYLLDCLLEKASHSFDISDYSHPQLQDLLSYDQETGQDFFSTLKTYLESNCNANAAAKKLFISRNALIYRLQKIEDILDLPLDNNDVCLSLRVSCRIMELQKNVGQ